MGRINTINQSKETTQLDKGLTGGRTRSCSGSEGTELMFSWFRLTRSISGVNTTGVPLAELSLYNTYRTEAHRPEGPVRPSETHTDSTSIGLVS